MADTDSLPGFSTGLIDTGETTIFVATAGSGRPLLLLHGFPETHLMWRGVGPLLAREFSVVCADLRGYGRSGCPPSDPDHAPYSKRAMARDMVAVMDSLGYPRFSIAGHDRGGRAAYRLALDHPARVERLAVLDIVPTDMAWERADDRFALGYWPWSLLAQPVPLPERILTTSAEAIVDDALTNWGSSTAVFPTGVRALYAEVLRDPEHAHAICEEYRAAATVDRQHDRDDAVVGKRIASPVLAVWSVSGPLASWYGDTGPLGLWQAWADDVQARPIGAGHFFPEEAPAETAAILSEFLGGT